MTTTTRIEQNQQYMKQLPEPVISFIQATNSFDTDAFVATFGDDALVNDAQREFWGPDAIRRWASREMIGDEVTMLVTDVKKHHGTIIVNAEVDGEFNKTNLPDPLLLTFYFTVEQDKIVQLIILLNRPSNERAIPALTVAER
jgi:hypothetical protein